LQEYDNSEGEFCCGFLRVMEKPELIAVKQLRDEL
jgi:hypothetical protein